ncbi:MAG: DUF1036 domain-containing protein, partial [Okeania sp. SIO3B3]|nr:DUF1036 domain-containing protein [Okeania sp. SIO3B3]
GKIYYKPTPQQVEKLKLMLAHPPKNPTASQNHTAISWPIDLIIDSQKNCVGFLMPEISNAKEMINIYHPKLRCQEAPKFNWYCLHIIALNFVSILKEIHARNYIIGDISAKNILVNDRSLVSLIDTDSFQVKDSKTGKIYRCSVGSEGFIPPELVGKNLSQFTQTRYNDRFRLAVIIYYLLFGYHPFTGKWTGSGDPPGQNESISKGYWPYGINSLLIPSPNTIPLKAAHPILEKLFLKCFNDGHKKPSFRPSPEDWFQALQVAINGLEVCSKNRNHIYSKHYGQCYWCERANNLNVDVFPSVQQPIHPKRILIKKSSSSYQANKSTQNTQKSSSSYQANKSTQNTQKSSSSYQANKSTQNTQKSSSSVGKNMSVTPWKTIATISTIISTALVGLSFLQYQERNQVIKQIERLREQNKLPSGKWDLSSYSLELELENFGNIIEGEKPLIYFDIDDLIKEMRKKNTSLDENIENLQAKVKNLEEEKEELKDKNKNLEEEKEELKDKNNSLQNRINRINNNYRQNRNNESKKYTTYINFCNKTSHDKIYAAFTYWNENEFLSEGWYRVESEKCRKITVAQNYRDNIYVYGMYNRGKHEWGKGKDSFCINLVDKFTISKSDKVSCNDRNQKRVSMSYFYVSPGTNTWNFY